MTIWIFRINVLPNIFRRFKTTVTVQAPSHSEWLSLIHAIHLFDVSVTGFASYALSQVAFVIEVRMIRQFVNPYPLNRLTFFIGFSDFLDPRTVCSDHRVAVHTSRKTRHARMIGFVCRSMAVATFNLERTSMQLVTEWNGLFGLVALVGCSWQHLPSGNQKP